MPTLTAKQQYWAEHLQQADSFDGSLAEYARMQGVSAQHLYQWRNILRKREITQVASETVFTEVTRSGFDGSSLTLQLGNAQMTFQSLPDTQWLANLIAAHG